MTFESGPEWIETLSWALYDLLLIQCSSQGAIPSPPAWVCSVATIFFVSIAGPVDAGTAIVFFTCTAGGVPHRQTSGCSIQGSCCILHLVPHHWTSSQGRLPAQPQAVWWPCSESSSSPSSPLLDQLHCTSAQWSRDVSAFLAAATRSAARSWTPSLTRVL